MSGGGEDAARAIPSQGRTGRIKGAEPARGSSRWNLIPGIFLRNGMRRRLRGSTVPPLSRERLPLMNLVYPNYLSRGYCYKKKKH